MRYLLGTLSQDDETRIEEAFFGDDATFEQLEIAEAELIDAYVQKELSPEDQTAFEVKLRASPLLSDRVKFARLLKDKAADSFSTQQEVSSQPAYAGRQAEPKPKSKWWEGLLAQPGFRVATAAGVFVILLGGVALLLGWRNLRNDSNQLASERAALQRQRLESDQRTADQQTKTEQLAADLQRERDQRAEDLKLIEELQRTDKLKETTTRQPLLTTFATVFLTPGSLRSVGGDQTQLTIGPETTTARLQLALEKNDYPTYNAAIRTADGTVVFRNDGLKPHNTGSGPQLFLSVPSRRLTPGDYTVHVDGVTTSSQAESVNDYAFRVLKRK